MPELNGISIIYSKKPIKLNIDTISIYPDINNIEFYELVPYDILYCFMDYNFLNPTWIFDFIATILEYKKDKDIKYVDKIIILMEDYLFEAQGKEKKESLAKKYLLKIIKQLQKIKKENIALLKQFLVRHKKVYDIVEINLVIESSYILLGIYNYLHNKKIILKQKVSKGNKFASSIIFNPKFNTINIVFDKTILNNIKDYGFDENVKELYEDYLNKKIDYDGYEQAVIKEIDILGIYKNIYFVRDFVEVQTYRELFGGKLNIKFFIIKNNKLDVIDYIKYMKENNIYVKKALDLELSKFEILTYILNERKSLSLAVEYFNESFEEVLNYILNTKSLKTLLKEVLDADCDSLDKEDIAEHPLFLFLESPLFSYEVVEQNKKKLLTYNIIKEIRDMLYEKSEKLEDIISKYEDRYYINKELMFSYLKVYFGETCLNIIKKKIKNKQVILKKRGRK